MGGIVGSTTTQKIDGAALRKDFPVFQREFNGFPLHYLDSGASSQMPQSVIDTITNYRSFHHANVHRSVYTLAAEATEQYEGARKIIARFIHAPSTREVIFTKNVTEALNLVAFSWGRANLHPGDAIVLTPMEHHANLVPWLMLSQERDLELRYLPLAEDGTLDLEGAPSVLEGAKLLSFTAVSNVLGTINPAKSLIALAKNAGAIVIIDGAQSAPHMPVDVATLGADFYAFTGHKMLGPTGIGVLWGREDLLQSMPPFLGGGDMIADVRLDGFTTNELPWKFEAGTPPIAEAIGLGAACKYLDELGMNTVRAHEQHLTQYALAQLRDHLGDAITIFGPPMAEDRGGLISFTLEDVHPHDVGQVLGERGVCVRASHHCAKPLHRILGVPATVRASFSVYNDTDDVDALCESLLAAREFFAR